MKLLPRCHGATTASPTISARAARTMRAKPPKRESQITRSLTSTLPHFGHRRCSKDSSTASEMPNPGSPFTPRRSLVRRSNSQALSEVSPALSDILCSIPTRHGPQSWRQKRCRSARIIVYQVNNNRRPSPCLFVECYARDAGDAESVAPASRAVSSREPHAFQERRRTKRS